MNRATKAAVTAALLPFLAVPTAGAVGLLPVGPAKVLTHGPAPEAMADNLQGALCEGLMTCSTVPYVPLIAIALIPGLPPIGLDTNVKALNDAIEAASGKKIVFGLSGGARGTLGWMEEHAADDDAPAFNELSFVLIGNPTRKYGGFGAPFGDSVMNPDTPYEVLDIARQYDLVSDFPQNPFNLLALANAFHGFTYVHLDYSDVDVDDPANTVWTEGNITYVFVPTQNLPLLEPLRQGGMGWLADMLNEPLKAIVEQGYNRDMPSTTSQSFAPEITSAQIDSGQLRTMSLAAESGGVELSEDTDKGAGGFEGTPAPVAKPVDALGQGEPVTGAEANDEVTPTVDVVAEVQDVDATAGGDVAENEVRGNQEGTPGDEPDGSSEQDTTVKKVKPNSTSAKVPSADADPDQKGGPKHRLPRTSLRAKPFPEPSKVGDTSTVAKTSEASEAGAGAKGDADAGGGDE